MLSFFQDDIYFTGEPFKTSRILGGSGGDEITEDVKGHVRRMKILRGVADDHNDRRKYLGAAAGAVVDPEASAYARKTGFYVIRSEGFKPRVWQGGHPQFPNRAFSRTGDVSNEMVNYGDPNAAYCMFFIFLLYLLNIHLYKWGIYYESSNQWIWPHRPPGFSVHRRAGAPRKG
jgi:hypothetical protein